MTSILSAISGQFGKSLILGTFFPVALFVTCALLCLPPLLPYNLHSLPRLRFLDTQGLITVSLTTIILTGALYNLNIPIIRCFEGYPWKDSWIGKYWTDKFARRLTSDTTIRMQAELFDSVPKAVLVAAGLSKADGPRRAQLRRITDARSEIGRSLTREYPSAAGAVLPTRLGNVVRSFEHYPRTQYNISAISLWPRLIAVIDKEYAAAIDDAKTSVDFMINCGTLSGTLALIIAILGLLYPMPFRSLGQCAQWIGEIAGFALLAYASYRVSIGRAMAWGDLVKGAFDNYRWKLLDQLGYKQRPETLKEERRLWDAISRQIIYGDSIRRAPIEYHRNASTARTRPESVELEISRGVTVGNGDGAIDITLCVRNSDSRSRNAVSVVVSDALPEGHDYLWGSAVIFAEGSAQGEEPADSSSQSVRPVGTNPLKFQLGSLEHGKAYRITYKAVQLK